MLYYLLFLPLFTYIIVHFLYYLFFFPRLSLPLFCIVLFFSLYLIIPLRNPAAAASASLAAWNALERQLERDWSGRVHRM